MKKNNKSKILKWLLICLFIIYVSYIFIRQQITLTSYNKEKEYITSQINEQQEYKDTLLATRENVNSKEYIEQIARQKLNMYLPNERVYIDVGN